MPIALSIFAGIRASRSAAETGGKVNLSAVEARGPSVSCIAAEVCRLNVTAIGFKPPGTQPDVSLTLMVKMAGCLARSIVICRVATRGLPPRQITAGACGLTNASETGTGASLPLIT